MNGPLREHPGQVRMRPVAPFAVIAELSVLYEIASLGMVESEEQLGHEAAEKVSRLFGARYFAILKGPLLHQRPIVMWGTSDVQELKAHLMRSRPNQFRFAFALAADESATIFVEQARPVDDREARLYTILARRIQTLMVMFKNRKDLENALAANLEEKRRILSVIQSIAEGVVVTDVEGHIELMNPAAEILAGWPADEAKSKFIGEVFRVVDERNGASPEKAIARLLRNGATGRLTDVARCISRDGRTSDVSISCVAIQDELGNRTGAVWVFHDETERMQMQRELQQTLQKLQKYIDVAGGIIVALDRNARITLINRKGREVLGARDEDLIGKDWFQEFIPEDQRAETRKVFARLMESNAEVASHFENPVLCRDGTLRVIEWFNTVLCDDAGRCIGTLSSGADVTELRAAEREREQQLSELRRWHRVTLGREEAILRLKAEVNELCQKLGLPPRYEITK